MSDKNENAGVTSSNILFCDMRCEHASFPRKRGLTELRAAVRFRQYGANWYRNTSRRMPHAEPDSERDGLRANGRKILWGILFL